MIDIVNISVLQKKKLQNCFLITDMKINSMKYHPDTMDIYLKILKYIILGQ